MLGVTQLDRVVEVVEHAIQGNTISLLTHRRSMPSLDLPKVRRNSFVEIIPISGGCLGNCSLAYTQAFRIFGHGVWEFPAFVQTDPPRLLLQDKACTWITFFIFGRGAEHMSSANADS